jgi:hypothetical protein
VWLVLGDGVEPLAAHFALLFAVFVSQLFEQLDDALALALGTRRSPVVAHR